jgi:hypothetical protein
MTPTREWSGVRASIGACAVAAIAVAAVWMVVGPWPGFITFLAAGAVMARLAKRA